MNVLTREQWGARPPSRSYVHIDWSSRPGLETHHSVGVYGTNNPEAFARGVQNDHLGRGWTDIFYNYLLWYDGTIIEGRPDFAKSGPISHLTICFAGNYNNRSLTDAQNISWHYVRDYLTSNGGGNDVAWHGQRAAVGCPGSNVINWLEDNHPLPQSSKEEEPMNVLPLIRERGTEEVYVAAGGVLIHVKPEVWQLMDDRKASEIKVLPSNHPVLKFPRIS